MSFHIYNSNSDKISCSAVKVVELLSGWALITKFNKSIQQDGVQGHEHAWCKTSQTFLHSLSAYGCLESLQILFSIQITSITEKDQGDSDHAAARPTRHFPKAVLKKIVGSILKYMQLKGLNCL